MHALWAVDETPWRTRTPVFRVSRRRLTRDRVCERLFRNFKFVSYYTYQLCTK